MEDPGDRGIQSLPNLDSQVFERCFKIKMYAFISFLVYSDIGRKILRA